MEQGNHWGSRSSRKRKLQNREDPTQRFPINELNEDLLERVLSWLPTSAFFRCTSVCKRWKTVANSASFKLACSEIPSRDPWFFMVDRDLNRSIIFDSADRTWKALNHPVLLQESTNLDSMPVSASGGLVCFRNNSGDFIVCNPVTGFSSKLPRFELSSQREPIHAIAMSSSCSKSTGSYEHYSYKVVVVSGELPRLSCHVYNSKYNSWEEILLRRKVDEDNETLEIGSTDEDNAVYFLNKSGNVVVTDMQRSPTKQYSAVTITKHDGEETVYFLSSSGTVISCSLTHKCFFEYPRLLPATHEYSIDVMECRGQMVVAVLSEFCESASLRIWRFDELIRAWVQVAAMPTSMSHEFYNKKVDINCIGVEDRMFICLNSADVVSYVMFDLRTNEWLQLPKCFVNGEALEFLSAFAFQPRIEVPV